MSFPAREVSTTAGASTARRFTPSEHPRSTRRPAAPARTTAARPPTRTPPQSHRRARRGPHFRFLLFAGAVTTVLVVMVVALNAVLAQAAFRVHETQSAVDELREQNEFLTTEVAGSSSPGRVADWARAHGMSVAETVVILRVRGTAPTQGSR